MLIKRLLGICIVLGIVAAVPFNPNRGDNFAAVGGSAITKHDTDIDYTILANARYPRGLIVGDTGAVKLTLMDGSVVSFTDNELQEGVLYPFCVKRIWNTGTNATQFIVVW